MPEDTEAQRAQQPAQGTGYWLNVELITEGFLGAARAVAAESLAITGSSSGRLSSLPELLQQVSGGWASSSQLSTSPRIGASPKLEPQQGPEQADPVLPWPWLGGQLSASAGQCIAELCCC